MLLSPIVPEYLKAPAASSLGTVGRCAEMAVTGDLGRYRVIRRLGAGGMASVDLAQDTVLGRRVALKRVLGADDVQAMSRLRREALAGASISHPNVVPIYDVVAAQDGHLVIAMEYVDGETLRELLNRQGRLPVQEALRILEGAAAGLDAIHARGIVHRDVKPSNILLGPGGVVKIADLGIASVADRTRITVSGAVLGSLSYMAPEQLEDARATPAIDVYALAVVAFELLSGAKARTETHPVALAHAISSQEPPRLDAAWPAAPQPVTDVVRQAMSRDPGRRPSSAGELVRRLRAALEPPAAMSAGPPTERMQAPPAPAAVPAPGPAPARRRAQAPAPPRAPAPARETPPSRRRGVGALAALALVAAAAALVVLLVTSGASPSARRGATKAAKTHSAAARKPGAGTTRASSSASTTTPAGTTSTSASTTPPASTTSTTAPATSSAGAQPPTQPAAPPPGSAASSTPVAAVESFYRLAAAHRFPDAWALADPALRAQLGGYPSFESGQAGDRSITFDSARAVNQTGSGATVAITTTSVRDDGTHHCTGTVDAVPAAPPGHWQLHQVHINCS
jgi:hypothetical protein